MIRVGDTLEIKVLDHLLVTRKTAVLLADLRYIVSPVERGVQRY